MESGHKGFQHRGTSYTESEMKKHADNGFYETKEGNAVCSTTGDVVIGEHTVQRALEQRHISMIAIGTGLFLGMGEALNKGGPVGLVLGYLVMGLVVYAMTVALGEMVTMFPVSGSFTHYPCRFVDPALGFAVGWNYWYSMTIAVPSEVIASAIVVEYWKAPVNKAVWVTLFIVLGCAINFLGVRWYGEQGADRLFTWYPHVCEPTSAAVKVVAVVILIIVGIVIDLGGTPTHDRIGLRHIINPGPFNQLHGIPGATGRFLAFWTVFLQASYSYMGTEMVAITAGEAANPRKTVPKAIERVFYRILVFYLGSTITVGLLVPSTSPELLGGTGDASSSPFVIAIKSAGITVLPDLINVVILVSAISAASSKLYGGSRVLFGLSKDGMAPRIFSKCNGSGLPIWALMATCSAAGLSYMCLNNQASVAFQWFQNLSAMTGILTWWAVLVSYLFFYNGMKVQGYSRDTLHYKAPFQPYASWIGVIMLTVIMFMSGFEVFLKGGWSISDFLANYLTLPIFLGFYLYWKIAKRTKFVSPKHMDFVTGTRELDEMDAQEREKAVVPTTKWGKFIDWLM
ncbi:hypothetical protein PSHT_14076 [Puccinia striiformis]|uniref:Amino acid permease/ SLC12A domain-containing protein n=2 Tax=Puccinia striiformis TaxID=27350 RepID=A0A2S4ULZ5_9BASI|nr:hypothetical protein PSHT_14076 [Puccinia striiformis]POW05859.1 hypothetical protein PSTT_09389 [Puccinia striiformis]